MTSYILHVSLLLGLGFILYQVLLKKETFYALNRVILSSYLILAFTLPLIHIPASWSLQTITPVVLADHVNSNKTHVTSDQSHSAQIATPQTNQVKDSSTKNELLHTSTKTSKATEEVASSSSLTMFEKLQQQVASFNWISALKWTYLIGLAIFLINFLVQFSILIYYRIKYPTLQDGKMTIVEMEGDKAPFSFLHMIYINPSKYDYDTYEQILAHEKIHITKWHSLDIFLSEMALIVLWFNPFAWLYRKVVEHNLEYLTDQEMLASGANAENYQMNLLKVSVPELPLSLSTNYNQSFLKKRIHMMNAKKSSARSTWKYLFILPILGLTVALFNPTQSTAQPTKSQDLNSTETFLENIEAQESPQNNGAQKITLQIEFPVKDEKASNEEKPILVVNNQTEETKSAIEDLSMFEINQDVDLTVSKTENGFKIVSSDGRQFDVNKQNDKTTIINAKEDIENDGNWEAELRNNSVCLSIKRGSKGHNYYWSSSDCFLASDFTPSIKANTEGKFSLTRGPGTLHLTGKFTANNGSGSYEFTPDLNFIAQAKNEGFVISPAKLIHFFLSGIDGSYFSFLKSNGYTNIDEDEMLALAIHDVDEEYIRDINNEFKQANYNKPSVEELIALKIHDVDMDYIKSFGKELYQDLTVDQIIAAAIHDVDPKFIKEFKALGYSDLSFDNLIAAAIHDVDVEYVKKLKGAGFEDLSFDNLIAASIHDVDPAYIQKFKNAGFKDLSFDDMISASIHDVDPEYITAFKSAGLDLDFDDLISASIHDIDVDYIQEFQNAGFTDLKFDDLVAAGIHDVDVSYLKEAKAYGFNLTFDQLISASIHDVDLEYMDAFSKAGFKNLKFDDLITASIHDIDPDFIKDFYALGYSDLSFENVVAAAIHDIDIEFIKGFKEAGFTDLTFDNFVAAAIHDIDAEYIKEIKASGIENITFDDIISFGIHDIDMEDMKELKDMGFNLSTDKMIEAGIHGITPKFIKKMQAKGYKDLEFDEYVKLKIHGF